MRAINFSMAAIVIMLSFSTAYAGIQITPNIQGCVTSLSLNATEKIEIKTGETAEMNATIWNVKCGIKHVRFALEGIPSEWYSVEPQLYASVAPIEQKTFKINFKIPEDAASQDYTGTYVVKTEEKDFKMHAFTLSVEETEPLLPANSQQPTAETEIQITKPITEAEVSEALGHMKKYFDEVGVTTTILTFISVAIVLLAQAFGAAYEEERQQELRRAFRRVE